MSSSFLFCSYGVPIYAEIPRDAVPYLKPYLEEGKIVYMSKITVQTAKPEYRAVENPCMIKLNKRTQIRDAHNQPSDFPKYTFSLIPIEKLPDYAKSKERFLGNVIFCFHRN
jgi:replication factor A1